MPLLLTPTPIQTSLINTLCDLLCSSQKLDGTRSLQYTISKRFPQGFLHRYFDTWYTWEARSQTDGRNEYVIAYAPMESYTEMGGKSYHKADNTGRMVKGSLRGVHIIRELTDNTCEWDHIGQYNLKVSLPKPGESV